MILSGARQGVYVRAPPEQDSRNLITRLRRFFVWVRETIRHEGYVILAWRALVKLLSPVVELDAQILFDFDLTQPIEQRRARVDCTVMEATEVDTDELLQMRFPALPPGDERGLSDADEYRLAVAESSRARLRAVARLNIRQWFRAGEKCFVARVDGAIAHSNWIRFHGCGPAPHREIDPGEGEVYMTEGFTVSQWRGKALHEAVNTHMLRYAQARGCRLALTITDFTNARPRRALLRIGWKYRGHHLFIGPRRMGRTWMLRLGGDVGPIVRDLMGEPIRLL
jgi:hypothetical protein